MREREAQALLDEFLKNTPNKIGIMKHVYSRSAIVWNRLESGVVSRIEKTHVLRSTIKLHECSSMVLANPQQLI